MNFFIQLDQQNSNIVRYFAIGEHDSENKFTGRVYGYEGGGVHSDAFIYKSKNLPSYFEVPFIPKILLAFCTICSFNLNCSRISFTLIRSGFVFILAVIVFFLFI